MEKLFAKPFVKALSGHADGVYAMAKDPHNLSRLASCSADGELRIWNISNGETVWKTRGHAGFVRSVCFSPLDGRLISAGDDKMIRVWNWQRECDQPSITFKGKNSFGGVSHHRSKNVFASCSSVIDIWDEQRSEPVSTFSWGADTINTVAFNQTEVSVLASTGTDRTITLYDVRFQAPLSKNVLAMKSNAVAWNPMEAFNFTVANEDHNCYTFDMRKMDKALNIFKDHVSAVLDVDYSPTGHEIVTGSYDKTMRIFPVNQGHSRDIYHTSRMQHLFCVKYSMDAQYVFGGSDDGNIRLWKSNAAKKIGPVAPRQRNAAEYVDSLKERFKHMPEVKRISRHRHVPKVIKTTQEKKRIMLDSRNRKQERRVAHVKPGTFVKKPQRKSAVVAVQE